MKLLYSIFLLVALSCNDNKSHLADHKESIQIDVLKSDSSTELKLDAIDSNLNSTDSALHPLDTFKKMIVDDYPLGYTILSAMKGDRHNFEVKSGQTYSYDKCWFINDVLQEALVVELYTDGFRQVIYHFCSNDVPDDLINRVELHRKGGDLASETQRLKDFSGFLKEARRIDSSYFVSKKGFRLGDSKQKAIAEYGKADKQLLIKGFEMLEWRFEGDFAGNARLKSKEKSLAKNSYGHKVLMYFRKDKLSAQILYNEIP